MSKDEQIISQAEELGRMLASSGSFANVAKAITRGFAEAQTGEAQRRAHLALLGAEALVRGSETARGWVVQDARDLGLSWSTVGGALEISKQGAQQRYGTA